MKKWIAILLCLALMLGAMSACSNNNDKPTDPVPTTTEKQEPDTTTKEGEQTAEPTEPAPVAGKLPLVDEPTTIRIGIPQRENVPDYDENAYTKWLEEVTGVNLEFVFFSVDETEQVTQLNLMISSGKEKLPDILWGFGGVSNSLRNELGEDGYLVDLMGYMNDLAYWSKEIRATYFTEDEAAKVIQYGIDPNNGALYAFPGYEEGKTDALNTHALINQKWLDAVGEKVPTTVDELYTVLKKFAEMDPNGNGQKDELPLTGSDTRYRADILEYIINAYVYCCDANIYNQTDGKIWVPYTTDEYREALKFCNKLYKEGLLSPLFYSINANPELIALNTPSDGVAIAGVIAGHMTVFNEKDNELLFDYTVLPPFKAETKLGGYAPMTGASFSYNCFITSDAQDPELCFKLLDFMSSRESYLHAYYGIEGTDWERAPEGTVDPESGRPVDAYVLVPGIYAGTDKNNHCWHQMRGIYNSMKMPTAISKDVDPTTYAARKNALMTSIRAAYDKVGMPDNPFQRCIYNAKEDEVIAEYQTGLKDYFAEARALFVSGVMDPNNDADWNTYLQNLKSLGLDDVLDAVQEAYTRMTQN